MGIETVLIIGATMLSAGAKMSAAQDEADAAMREGNLAAKNKSRQTRYRAASQQSSFLNSGLTLEGTPMAAIQSTFSMGLEDITQIQDNARSKAKSALSKGRSEAIASIMKGGASAMGGSMFGDAQGVRTFGTPDQTVDFGDYFSAGARSDMAYADAGGMGPYRF